VGNERNKEFGIQSAKCESKRCDKTCLSGTGLIEGRFPAPLQQLGLLVEKICSDPAIESILRLSTTRLSQRNLVRHQCGKSNNARN
jgi:hypothetical protein